METKNKKLKQNCMRTPDSFSQIFMKENRLNRSLRANLYPG